MVIAITRSGYVKRLPVTTYREQRRGGIGVMGMELKDEDYIEHLVVASTHDYLLFFTSVGKIYRLKVHELPLGSRQSKGRALVNLLPLAQGESVRTLIATRDFERSRISRPRDEERRRQEDALRRVQHPAQGRRDHRDQAARQGRARGGAALLRRGRHPHGLPQGAGDPLPRERCAADGPGDRGRARHESSQGRRGDRGEPGRGRRRRARRDPQRLRQAHADPRLSRQGTRRSGRPDGQADRGARRAGGRARRPRRHTRSCSCPRAAP